ncbi:MAG: SUMF1/EgtB/PvdO family nonheme iron enzyme [Acidobacteria bacterium]|nr:SUMF1/EgtB/PvdO family nonheme iron enzyme [Acidobacteriota bacterium]
MKRHGIWQAGGWMAAAGAVIWVGAGLLGAQSGETAGSYTNKLGMKMIRIPAGQFRMGNDRKTDPAVLKQRALFPNGDFDERPVHEVRISYDFHISETEVTAAQFSRFRIEYEDAGRFAPYVSGVSWHDAVAFCEWLSKREQRHYRLPTEAEWEYAARAGTETHFASGDTPPAAGEANAWGVRNMHSETLEWVLDWYGPYPLAGQTDPVGPAAGLARVVRGGGIAGPRGRDADGFGPYYRRSANRASVAPGFTGLHAIGFRVVEAELPKTPPLAVAKAFPLEFVKRRGAEAEAAPEKSKPWFRQRALLPVPPEDVNADAIEGAGLEAGVMGHNHAAGLAVAANGDVLWIGFSASTSTTEYLVNTTFLVSRLRAGSDEWDAPAMFYDFADVNDQTALLWNDGGTLRLFTGGVGLAGVPFRMQRSGDDGATWPGVELPLMRGPVGGFSPQPITSAFRTADGAMYVGSDGASDAGGGESLLWESRDEGVTWRDTGGRTAGRHTAFVLLKDGRILGLGGKNTNIDGYMPQAISSDRGRTWTVSKSVFPALSSNQRPTVVRLASGRIFFASDYQDRGGRQPAGVTERGSFVALSEDEGRTWKMKKLPNALPHEAWVMGRRAGWNESAHGTATIGYAVAAQGPNGVIHLVSSMNHPSQHFEMNEAWILSAGDEGRAESRGAGRRAAGEMRYPGGKLRARWSGVVSSARGYLLDGEENWLFEDGRRQYSVEWKEGRKVGVETLWSDDGAKVWEWVRRKGGPDVWVQYWPNGRKRHESSWVDGRCVGTAAAWREDGSLRARFEFVDGLLVRTW